MTASPTSPLEARAPFIWLEDSRDHNEGGNSRLYVAPYRIITAHSLKEVEPALEELRAATASGLHAAGWIAYEAGHAWEPRLAAIARPVDGPLLWFGLFDRVQLFDPVQSEAFWRQGRATPFLPAELAVTPEITQADYGASVEAVIAAITAGDVYQVNLTFGATGSLAGDPLALYAAVRQAQRVPFAAYIDTGDAQILSFSPELFFSLTDGVMTARPMKGTARRQPTAGADRAAAAQLAADPKNRAENLMIVDLMRNDLSKVSTPGSVTVSAPFHIEALATVHQMTTTIHARLKPGLGAVDALRALFPCGSVTGAPKIRAMEIIRALEPAPRGIYCGSIGWIAPWAGGDACFNVAIRTLAISADKTARLGLGAGIVADSDPADEWEECQLKGAFLAARMPPFDLIETLLWRPETGYWLLDEHLLRLGASARYWGFVLDGDAIRAEALAFCADWNTPMRIRLALARSGATCWQASPLGDPPHEPVPVVLAPLPVSCDSPFLAHKTSNRAFYDDARKHLAAQTGCYEVLFVNECGELAEGSFTTVFVDIGGQLLTPPLASGALSGILRRHLITAGRVREAVLTPADLDRATTVYIGNSVRGLLRCRLIR